MLSKRDMTRMLFQTIGSPIGTGTLTPDPTEIEQVTEYAFKSRVGLLFLDECLRRGVQLGPEARALHDSLTRRRVATDAVVVRLARKLNEIAEDEWVLFKSIKPFAATPNDTDWFPLDPRRHKELVDHLQCDGDFTLLEVAPRQTTLIEASGAGQTDTTKKGGIYYIDCYVYPSTDYFVYFDSRRLRSHVRQTQIDGYPIPVLSPQAELAAIMFHNVFPERSYTPESYYLTKSYLDLIEEQASLNDFIEVSREHAVEYAVAVNLNLTAEIDREQFSVEDKRIATLLKGLHKTKLHVAGFDPMGKFPYEIPNRNFWGAFFSKQRDKVARRSTGTQLLHMMNPIFFADVVKIIWRRSVRGGVYEQN